MQDYLFAYGTLVGGVAPPEIAPVVKNLRYVGRGTIKGRLYDLGDFPGAIQEGQDSSRVSGHVYELPKNPQVLRKLDEYEGYSPRSKSTSLFVRKRTQVLLSSGRTVRSWVYFYNRKPAKAPPVSHGDYLKLKKLRRLRVN
jgi:gamma-glutamylcyclotransferase (GGCT)/AIG2-like uncharacterized protein YtfP